MAQEVPGVELKFRGDATGVNAAADAVVKAQNKIFNESENLQRALKDVAYTSQLTNSQLGALQKAAQQAAGRVAEAATAGDGFRRTAKGMGEGISKASAAIGTLSAGMGAAAGQTTQLLTGVAGLAQAFAAGGPILAGVAALGVALSLINKVMEDQEAQAKRVDEAWQKAAATGVAARDKAGDSLKASQMDLMVARQQTGNASSDRVTAGQMALLVQLEEVNKQRLATTAKIATLEETIGSLQDDKLEVAEAELNGLRASAQSLMGAESSYLTQIDLLPKIALEQERIQKAAEARAKAEERAKEALERQQTFVANMVAHYGAIKDSVRAANDDRDERNHRYNGGMTPADQAAALAAGTGGIRVSSLTAGLQPIGGAEMNGIRGMGDFTDGLERMGVAVSAASGPLFQLSESAAAAAKDLLASVASGVMGGGGFNSAGAGMGAAIGGVVDVASGGATGGAGATIGAILGSVLGNSLDELVKVLGVVTPLMDGVAVAISALSPIFYVLKIAMGDIGKIFELSAPLIHQWAKPIAAMVLVFVRLLEVCMPLIGGLLLVAAALMSMAEVVTLGISWLDTNFFYPLAVGATNLANVFVDLYNAIITMIRTIPGFGKFGTKASHVAAPTDLFSQFATSVDDLAGIMDDNTAATMDNTDAAEAWGQDLANLPSGYKTARAEYDSQAAAPSVMGGGNGDMVINGDVIVDLVQGSRVQDIRASVQRYARSGQHYDRKGGSRRGIHDDRN